MGDRPDVLSAKLDRLAAVIADSDELKAMPQTERPNEASVDEVRSEYAAAVREVMETSGSVGTINQVETPTQRLGGN